MSVIRELEHRLRAAEERLDAAARALRPRHKGGEMEEYEAARAEVLTLERQLAAAKGEEYAVPCEFPVKWDIGAPMPHLLKDTHHTYLLFYVRVPDPNWDGTYATVRDPLRDSGDPVAVVEFRGCLSAKLGAPNDEVFHGHPLYGRGLDSYTAQVVQNSRWLMELEATNKVHDYYRPEAWKALKHYIFWFHDETFECVAESFHVEVFHQSLPDLLSSACRRMFR